MYIVHRARALAKQILEGEELDLDYLIHPEGYSDGATTEHFRKITTFVMENPDLFKSFHEPEILVEVLTALLTPLRQKVGSCFATAPAILVQSEMPHLFLRDIQEILAKGKLTRTFGGVEYTVPAQTGKDILQTWEYTIASFVDVKSEFSKWNLYTSLGLHAEEKGGIGELIYNHLNAKLAEANEKLKHYQTQYEIAFDEVRVTQALLRNASNEADGRRLRAELTSKTYHLRSCEEMRDTLSAKAHQIANFFPFLIEKIEELFQEHFQEVYDPDMRDVRATQYDDAPAGFRLMYKHGRRDVSSWTFIHTKEEYIDCLKAFFRAIEYPIIDATEWKKGHDEITDLITAIIHHISTDEFLISSFTRMAKAHRVPLQKVPLDQMEKKPWAYTSGGTINTLLKTYFRREGSLSEEARWVESPQDLLIFLLDALKSLSPRVTEPFAKDPTLRMLMTSPTHAFSLLPGLQPFRAGWEDPGFTYTWVRDQILIPARNFHKKFTGIRPDEARALLEELGIETVAAPPLTRKELHDFIIEHLPKHATQDLHFHVANVMRQRKLAPPAPIIFADTNWVDLYFAFVYNPEKDALEFWQTDKIGLTGNKLDAWEPFLNGTIRQPWRLFFRPHEYRL